MPTEIVGLRSQTIQTIVVSVLLALYLLCALHYQYWIAWRIQIGDPLFGLQFGILLLLGLYTRAFGTILAWKADSEFYALLCFSLAYLLAGWRIDFQEGAGSRLLVWSSAPWFYLVLRNVSAVSIRLSLVIAGVVSLLGPNMLWNENVESMALSITALLVVQGGQLASFLILWMTACYSMLINHTHSHIVSVPLALLLSLNRLSRRAALIAALAAGSILLFLRSNTARFLQMRDDFFFLSLDRFFESPLLGVGPSQSFDLAGERYFHAHNLWFTSMAELGLVGILCLAWFMVSVYRSSGRRPFWARCAVWLMLAWSTLDDPLQWWLINILFLFALSRKEGGTEERLLS